jgi:hypothetical protein
MSLQTHLEHLRERHHQLDLKIQQCERLLSTDPVTIHDLKKKKLKIKEEIESFSATSNIDFSKLKKP